MAPGAPRELENDPANGCVGCGPANPVGLRLRFTHDGDAVRARLRAGPELEGFPDRLHSGILYLALLETANWTIYGFEGRAGFPVRTGPLEAARWVPVGATLALAGRVTAREGARRSVLAEAADEQGPVARLARDFELIGEAELRRRMGYRNLPPELEGGFPG